MRLTPQIADWFAARGWQPRTHQLDMLEAHREGLSALLIAPTGAGKTLAGFLPSLEDLAGGGHDGLHTLYISPLKALAVDVARNLTIPIARDGSAHPRRDPHRRHARLTSASASATIRPTS